MENTNQSESNRGNHFDLRNHYIKQIIMAKNEILLTGKEPTLFEAAMKLGKPETVLIDELEEYKIDFDNPI